MFEIESSPGYSPSEMDLFKLCDTEDTGSQEDTEETELTENGFLKVQQGDYTGLCLYNYGCWEEVVLVSPCRNVADMDVDHTVLLHVKNLVEVR